MDENLERVCNCIYWVERLPEEVDALLGGLAGLLVDLAHDAPVSYTHLTLPTNREV